MGCIAPTSSPAIFSTKKEFEWEDIAPWPLPSKETESTSLDNWEWEIAADPFKEKPIVPSITLSLENQKNRDWEIVSRSEVDADFPYLATLTKLDSFLPSSILDDLFSSPSQYRCIKNKLKSKSTSQPYKKTNQKRSSYKYGQEALCFDERTFLGMPTCGKYLAPVKIEKPKVYAAQIGHEILEDLLKGNLLYFYLEDGTPALFEKRKGPFEVLSLSFSENNVFVNFRHYKGASPSLDQCLSVGSEMFARKNFDYLFLQATSQPLGSYFLLTTITRIPLTSRLSGELVSIVKSTSSSAHQKWVPKKTGIRIGFSPHKFGPLGFLGLFSERLLAFLNQDPPLFRIEQTLTKQPEILSSISLFKLATGAII